MDLKYELPNFNLYKNFWQTACIYEISLPYSRVMKKLICKIFGHRYQYNFMSYPSRCKCVRCGLKWKTAPNPRYVPGKSNPLSEDLEIWIEEK